MPDIRMKPRWIVFDLDDTLHDFSGAAAYAIDAAIGVVRKKYPAITGDALRETYSAICRERWNSFVDGQTSLWYRTDRFAELLRRHEISDGLVDDCVSRYAEAIEKYRQPLPGAATVLAELRRRGYSIAVVSEGPHDAQTRVLAGLGYAPYVHLMLTSNRERLSKRDGLFARFLSVTASDAQHCLVIGDSLENDIVPALQAGMAAVHYRPVRSVASAQGRLLGNSDYEYIRELIELLQLVP